jgi:hypothetical protein
MSPQSGYLYLHYVVLNVVDYDWCPNLLDVVDDLVVLNDLDLDCTSVNSAISSMDITTYHWCSETDR